jgi:hypothetical protein
MSMTTAENTVAIPNRSRPTGAIRTLTATAVAVGVNTLVWAFGRIGEPIRVIIGRNAEPEALAWFHVAITTVLAVVLGGLALAVMRRRNRVRAWVMTALAIAVGSAAPLWRLDIDTKSKVLLTVMHLCTGMCCVAAHLTERPISFSRRFALLRRRDQ